MTGNGGWLRGLVRYARFHRRWWLLPIAMVFLLFVAIVIVAELAPNLTPFLYTLH